LDADYNCHSSSTSTQADVYVADGCLEVSASASASVALGSGNFAWLTHSFIANSEIIDSGTVCGYIHAIGLGGARNAVQSELHFPEECQNIVLAATLNFGIRFNDASVARHVLLQRRPSSGGAAQNLFAGVYRESATLGDTRVANDGSQQLNLPATVTSAEEFTTVVQEEYWNPGLVADIDNNLTLDWFDRLEFLKYMGTAYDAPQDPTDPNFRSYRPRLDFNLDGAIDALDLAYLESALCVNGTSVIADMDASGGVDGDDLILFFSFWDQNDLRADADGSQSIDGDDVIVFMDFWNAGAC
jgi:hypothetical protein